MFFPLRFHNYNKKIKIEIMNSLQAIANTHQLYGIATEAFQFEKEGPYFLILRCIEQLVDSELL